MKKILDCSLALLFLIAFPAILNAKVDIPALLDRLDASLAHKEEYEQMKLERVEKLHKLFDESATVKAKYDASCLLFEEYRAYRYDSAIVYANHRMRLAAELGNLEYMTDSKLDMIYCVINSGVLMEAQEMLASIDRKTLPEELLPKYYRTYSKFWMETLSGMQNGDIFGKCISRARLYDDSLCNVTEEGTAEYYEYKGLRHMHFFEYKEVVDCYKKVLSFKDVDTHKRAILYAEMAWAYRRIGLEDEAIESFANSAICDNEAVVREVTALYHLAESIMKLGYTERAYNYIYLALGDINFYNTNHRKVELGRVLPRIEEERSEASAKQKNIMFVAIILVILVVISLTVTIVMVRKRNRILRMAEERDRKNIETLECLNTQLDEANKMKIEYIGQSLYANAEAITKMEKLCKSIERQLATKSYDKIRETISEKRLETERENMYAGFDAAFLGLFPNFVEEYNKLFAEKDQRIPEKENSLTPEMRIFALIRLGITSSERIGNFLDYSVHTVNTYKTRIKNKSIVDNNQFEALVCNM